mmetsp:Transcript_15931/g.23817  ORF Transcript_15931/g.23817 Transcript_15931/m.23817 type:complete len:288 (+) Transcript_15931:90-953(+)
MLTIPSTKLLSKRLFRFFSTGSPWSPFETITAQPDPNHNILFTCEHANQSLPPGYTWPSQDKHLLNTHWAYDPGAANLTRQLITHTQSSGVLSNFSRLFVDPNRNLPQQSLVEATQEAIKNNLFRTIADHRPVLLNHQNADPDDAPIDHQEMQLRVALCYDPFHEAISRLVKETKPRLLCSVHSFTRNYEDQPPREVEVGVLYAHEKDIPLANQLVKDLSEQGYNAQINQPWSGLEGFMYSAAFHGVDPSIGTVMLEVRQDLLEQEDWTNTLSKRLGSFFIQSIGYH